MSAGRPAVFFDRDGVLNYSVEREGRLVSPRTVEAFIPYPSAGLLIDKFASVGIPRFIVTNQPDISRGHMTPTSLDQMHSLLRAQVSITDIAVCPHDDRDRCDCRKPKPGMLRSLAQVWDVDLDRSVMIGDSWRDIEAGRAAGCVTILIDGPEGRGAAPDHRVATLGEAVDIAFEHLVAR